MTDPQLASIAKLIVDENLYMVLGTANESGRPWASPVYYAQSGYREFFWVSDPNARHSRSLAARPDVSLVVFDSRQPIGTGQAVYVEALARELTGAERDRGLAVFSRRSLAHGGREWTVEMVEPAARVRLYRAHAHALWVVDGDDRRVAVDL